MSFWGRRKKAVGLYWWAKDEMRGSPVPVPIPHARIHHTYYVDKSTCTTLIKSTCTTNRRNPWCNIHYCSIIHCSSPFFFQNLFASQIWYLGELCKQMESEIYKSKSNRYNKIRKRFFNLTQPHQELLW